MQTHSTNNDHSNEITSLWKTFDESLKRLDAAIQKGIETEKNILAAFKKLDELFASRDERIEEIKKQHAALSLSYLDVPPLSAKSIDNLSVIRNLIKDKLEQFKQDCVKPENNLNITFPDLDTVKSYDETKIDDWKKEMLIIFLDKVRLIISLKKSEISLSTYFDSIEMALDTLNKYMDDTVLMRNELASYAQQISTQVGKNVSSGNILTTPFWMQDKLKNHSQATMEKQENTCEAKLNYKM